MLMKWAYLEVVWCHSLWAWCPFSASGLWNLQDNQPGNPLQLCMFKQRYGIQNGWVISRDYILPAFLAKMTWRTDLCLWCLVLQVNAGLGVEWRESTVNLFLITACMQTRAMEEAVVGEAALPWRSTLAELVASQCCCWIFWRHYMKIYS